MEIKLIQIFTVLKPQVLESGQEIFLKKDSILQVLARIDRQVISDILIINLKYKILKRNYQKFLIVAQ